MMTESYQIKIGDFFQIIYTSNLTYYYKIDNIISDNESKTTIQGSNIKIKDDSKYILIDNQHQYKIDGLNQKISIKFSRELSSEETLFTGIRDIDINILLKLDDVSLVNVCETDKYANKLCNDDMLWNQKIEQKYE